MVSNTGTSCVISIVVNRNDSSVASVVVWVQPYGSMCKPPDSLLGALLAGGQPLSQQKLHPITFFSDSVQFTCPSSQTTSMTLCVGAYDSLGGYLGPSAVDFVAVLR
jgi:hypothetical protein